MYLKIARYAWWGLLFAVVAVVLFAISLGQNWFNLYGGYPSSRQLENPKTELASELYSADSVLLGKYFRENRTQVSFSDISPNMVNALLASEDVRFYEHSGIDMKGTLAVPVYLFTGQRRRGSSTITQQLAKNLFKTRRDESLEGNLQRLNIGPLTTVVNKFKEWVLAIKLERNYTKEEIIEMYLNTVDFGSNSFGIAVAAKTFFGTTPDQLTIPQSAVLVGLLRAPSYYSPRNHPERATSVRNTVIAQMGKYDFVTEEEADSLMQTPLVLEYQVENHYSGLAPYFRAEILKELQAFCKANGYDLYRDGLKIYTTIDSRMQKMAEESMAQHMREQQRLFFDHWKGQGDPWIDENGRKIPNFLENALQKTDTYKALKKKHGGNTAAINAELNRKRKMTVFSWEHPGYEKDTLMSTVDSLRYYKYFLRGGMMAMDNKGQIKAWVGGNNYKYFKYDQVRQGYRQPGSTFKPLLYSAALEDRFTPCSRVADVPITFTPEETGSGVAWTPKNADGVYSGQSMTLRQAMGRSVNTAAAYLMKQLGPDKVTNYVRDRFGFQIVRDQLYDHLLTPGEKAAGRSGYDKKPLRAVPALALGTEDVSLFEMVAAYGTFISQGVWNEPMFILRIEDKHGRVLKTFTPKHSFEALTPKTAWTMTYMLRGSNEESNGTSLGLNRYKFKQGNQVGGKTGTTSNYSDAWFMGLTKDLVAGVWVGGEDRSVHFRSIRYGQGSKQAMPAYAYFMEKVYADPELSQRYKKGAFEKPTDLPMDYDSLGCSEYDRANQMADQLEGGQQPTEEEDDGLL